MIGIDIFEFRDMSPEELEAAPETFRELVRLTSVPEAVALCEAYPGFEIRLPAPDTQKSHEHALRSELRDLLTEQSYARLLNQWGGDRMYVPRIDSLKRQRRNRIIREAYDHQLQCRQPVTTVMDSMQRRFGITRSYLFRILKKVE